MTISRESRRLVIKSVPQAMTKSQIVSTFLQDFEDINVHSPKNTHGNRGTKLVFVDFPFIWAARVAKRLINIIQHETSVGTVITADFAECNESQFNEKLPALSNQVTTHRLEVKPGSRNCSSCSKSSLNLLACSKCSTDYSATFYCNRHCQAMDFSVHKRRCQPLPKLKYLDDIRLCSEKPKKKFLVPFVHDLSVGDIVKITHIQSTKVLFVRPANGNFQEMLTAISKITTNSKLSEKPEVDDTVLAPLEGAYHRAQIIDIREDDVQVFFLDHGNSTQIRWQQLRKLTFKGRSLPRQTFKIVLEGDVSNSSNDQTINNYLQSLYMKESELKIVRMTLRGQDRYVTLEDFHVGKVVNEFSSKVPTVNDDSRIFFDVSNNSEQREFSIHVIKLSFKNKLTLRLETGKNVRIKVRDVSQLSSGLVSVLASSLFSKFWKLDVTINEFANTCSTNEIYEPLLNEICLAKIKERWHRAVPVGFQVKTVAVRLLDFGNSPIEVPSENLRKIPREFTTGFFTNVCCIGDWNDSMFVTAKDKIKTNGSLIVDTVSSDCENNMTKLFFDFLA